MLAQTLLTAPKMFNHHRGLWGYTGIAADGEPLTIQSTGMGGPSAAIVLWELADLGVRHAIRVGTCGALDPGLGLGDLVVVGEALADDGTSRALGAGARVVPDPTLTAALGAGSRVVASADLFYARDGAQDDAWRSAGAVAVDLESAALLAAGAARRVAVASLLVVASVADGRLEGEALEPAASEAGSVAAQALLSG
jgi:uridine phosphorylase